MVAVLEPRPALRPAPRPPARPDLRLIVGGRADRPRRPIDAVAPWGPLAGAVGLVLLAVVVAVAIALGAFAPLAPGPTGGGASVAAQAGARDSVVVEAGDTLWSIARQLQPVGDVRPLVARLVELNGSAAIRPGQVLALP